MNSTQILFLLIGVFLIINAGNILQVFQGKATINIATGSRTQTSNNPITSIGGGNVAKGKVGVS